MNSTVFAHNNDGVDEWCCCCQNFQATSWLADLCPPRVTFRVYVELLYRCANVVSRGSVLNEQRSAALCLLNTLWRPLEIGRNDTTTTFLHVYILTPNYFHKMAFGGALRQENSLAMSVNTQQLLVKFYPHICKCNCHRKMLFSWML